LYRGFGEAYAQPRIPLASALLNASPHWFQPLPVCVHDAFNIRFGAGAYGIHLTLSLPLSDRATARADAARSRGLMTMLLHVRSASTRLARDSRGSSSAQFVGPPHDLMNDVRRGPSYAVTARN